MIFVKITRNIFKVVLALLAALLLYLAAAGVSAWITLPDSDSDAPKPYTVYLASNGIHMNIVLPVQEARVDWAAFLPDAGLGDKRYVYIGWGSAAFYTQVPTWRDIRLQVALKALFYDEGLLRVEGADAPPPREHDLVRAIALSHAQYRALVADIQAQFAAREALAEYPGFYPAKGHYTPLFTCNEWMRRRLRGIGLPTPLWSPFDRPLLWKF